MSLDQYMQKVREGEACERAEQRAAHDREVAEYVQACYERNVCERKERARTHPKGELLCMVMFPVGRGR